MKDYKCHESFCKKVISCAQHSLHFSTVINPNNAVFSLKCISDTKKRDSSLIICKKKDKEGWRGMPS